MIYTPLTNKAIDLAYEYHHGQKDKAGRPYIVHVLHVAEQMDDEFSACAALLHDTLEDTELSPEVLEREFPREVVEAVKLLTHQEGTDYFEYVRRVAQNPIARKVKRADLAHNLDISRFDMCAESLVESARKRSNKYLEALRVLQD
ncbi:MAG: bifunctional (p)ppGpp synthetase/guanosine-3',5'-bis(diphosphate) 3'-pyrophosphohydrolase [Synergistaceae bacterium]|nr:bifunctional (p)ppGpp synthetase/guanosine-3',5'-bis(diphosphate) 3'-pyrophosphohydrolase [Synergistaceae bacterium]